MAAREPVAFAKLATRNDVIPPFYITDDYVKARDESGYPVKIEVILGRSPQPGGPIDEFDADFHIGHRMKISRRHAMIYWSHEKQCFELKSICKNAVRVNGQLYPGSPDGNGKPARLDSQSYIEIADGERLYFLLPKVRAAPVEKPRYTYEQLLVSVLEPDRQLTFTEIIAEIQNRYPYYNNDTHGDVMATTWKNSLRTTLGSKTRVFEKTARTDDAHKKVAVYCLRRPGSDLPEPAAAQAAAGGHAGAMAGAAAAALPLHHDGIGLHDLDAGGGLGAAPAAEMRADGDAPGGLGSVVVIDDSPEPAGGGAADPAAAVWSHAPFGL